jgi:hypothetical protein
MPFLLKQISRSMAFRDRWARRFMLAPVWLPQLFIVIMTSFVMSTTAPAAWPGGFRNDRFPPRCAILS